jgi:hypothetical protein
VAEDVHDEVQGALLRFYSRFSRIKAIYDNTMSSLLGFGIVHYELLGTCVKKFCTGARESNLDD